MLLNHNLFSHELFLSVYVVDTVLVSVLLSFTQNWPKNLNINDGARCNKVNGTNCNICFLHFLSKGELIVKKVISLQCPKLKIFCLNFLTQSQTWSYATQRNFESGVAIKFWGSCRGSGSMLPQKILKIMRLRSA